MISESDQGLYLKHGTTFENAGFFIEIIGIFGLKMPKTGKLAEILLNMGLRFMESLCFG